MIHVQVNCSLWFDEPEVQLHHQASQIFMEISFILSHFFFTHSYSEQILKMLLPWVTSSNYSMSNTFTDFPLNLILQTWMFSSLLSPSHSWFCDGSLIIFYYCVIIVLVYILLSHACSFVYLISKLWSYSWPQFPSRKENMRVILSAPSLCLISQ